METKTYYANVRTGLGEYMRVSVQAETFYQAQKMMESMYGKDKLMTVPAPLTWEAKD